MASSLINWDSHDFRRENELTSRGGGTHDRKNPAMDLWQGDTGSWRLTLIEV